jgi:hypothetical protein
LNKAEWKRDLLGKCPEELYRLQAQNTPRVVTKRHTPVGLACLSQPDETTFRVTPNSKRALTPPGIDPSTTYDFSSQALIV